MAVRIVADSSSDLPAELAEASGIAIVPLTVSFGDESYVDRDELSTDRFWDRFAEADALPTTAAPPPGRFAAVYRRLAAEGANGVLVVTMSGAMSGTYGAAMAAVADSPVPVTVVDSRLVSMALGQVAVATARAAADGADLVAAAGAARAAAATTGIVATLAGLDHLRRGGRIGGAAAFVGNLLNVQPIIEVTDGEVTPAGRVRTRRRALLSLLDRIPSTAALEAATVVHSAPEEAAALAELLEDRLDGIRVPVVRIGPVVGSHTGPGVIGICHTSR